MFDKNSVVIIVLLLLIFSVNVYLLKLVIDKKELLSTNPAILTAQSFDINQCSCTTNSGKTFFFNQESIWLESKNSPGIKDNKLDLKDFNLSAYRSDE